MQYATRHTHATINRTRHTVVCYKRHTTHTTAAEQDVAKLVARRVCDTNASTTAVCGLASGASGPLAVRRPARGQRRAAKAACHLGTVQTGALLPFL